MFAITFQPAGNLGRLFLPVLTALFLVGSAALAVAESKPEAAVKTHNQDNAGGADEGIIRQLGRPRTRMTADSSSIAFSPRSPLLAIATDQGEIRFLDVAADREVGQPIRMPVRIAVMAFSPDGRFLAAGGRRFDDNSGMISIFDVQNRELVRDLGTDDQARVLQRILFTSDGRRIVAVVGTGVQIFDLDRNDRVRTLNLRDENRSPIHVALSPDDQMLAVVMSNNSIRLVRMSDGKQVGDSIDSRDIQHAIRAVEFMPDGEHLIIGRLREPLSIISIQTRKPVKTMAIPEDMVLQAFSGIGGLTMSADGGQVIFRQGNQVLLWNTQTQALRQILNLIPPLQSVNQSTVAVSADGNWAAVAQRNGQPEIFSLDEDAPLPEVQSHRGSVQALALSRDGRRVVSWGDDSRLLVWDVAENRVIHERRQPWERSTAMLELHDNFAMVASRRASFGTMLELDLQTGQVVEAEAPRVMLGARFVPGKREAVVTRTQSFEIYRWIGGPQPTFEMIGTLPSMGGPVMFTASGHRFVVLENRFLSIWDYPERKLIARFASPELNRANLETTITDDGSLMLVSNVRQELHFIDPWSGQLEVFRPAPDAELPRPPGGFPPRPVLMLPGSRDLLVTTLEDGQAVVLDTIENQVLHQFPRPNDAGVRSIQLSSDRQTLLFGLDDGTIAIMAIPTNLETSRPFDAAEAARLWQAIAEEEGIENLRASRRLMRMGAPVVPWIAQRLAPASADAQEVEGWINDLESPRFADRERAMERLLDAGGSVLPMIEEVLADPDTTVEILDRLGEVAREVSEIRLDRPERRLEFRAVSILAGIDTAESRALLQRYAAGAPRALLTEQARAQLADLAARPQP